MCMCVKQERERALASSTLSHPGSIGVLVHRRFYRLEANDTDARPQTKGGGHTSRHLFGGSTPSFFLLRSFLAFALKSTLDRGGFRSPIPLAGDTKIFQQSNKQRRSSQDPQTNTSAQTPRRQTIPAPPSNPTQPDPLQQQAPRTSPSPGDTPQAPPQRSPPQRPDSPCRSHGRVEPPRAPRPRHPRCSPPRSPANSALLLLPLLLLCPILPLTPTWRPGRRGRVPTSGDRGRLRNASR